MPISALPQSTVRLLGSSVIISKPCDVVKELLDNAIDAGASFVEIAISPNHLDTIRVRDDGQGIDIEDFDALGKRTHTSKLRAFDELGSRARETLGFRGEALAAMNCLATITVTTRTVKDVVATRLQLKPKVGGVDYKQPVSAPVGTTVQITKLFEILPARKQYSLKNSAKYIQSTKDLLNVCALARPDLRLSFKVLGEATHCWSYAPVCAAGVKEAALQLFGTTLTTSPQLNQQLPEDFILEALIPKPGFEVQAVKGKGLYLSIDSRPISSHDAVAKKIMAIYKPYLNRAAGTGEPCASIPNPFVQLNIRCPPDSYDVNVTPLKDEVVFVNEGAITACFEGLCRKIYPQRSINGPVSTQRPLGYEEEVRASTKDRNESEGVQPCSSIDRLPDAPTPDSSSNTQSLHSAEHLTKLQGSTRDQTVDQESAPTLLSEQSCTQSATSLARMRTCKTVNMFRTNSNSTDEDSAADRVEIQVPQSSMTATIPSSKRAGGSLRISNKSASENIEKYLLPSKDTTFQIATDETATKRTQQASVTSTSPTKFPDRIPLQPLTDSTLNAMNGQEDSESDTLSAESDISEPNNNTRSIVATNPTDRIFQRTSLNPTMSPSDSEAPGYGSPHQSRNITEWPTPPASDSHPTANGQGDPSAGDGVSTVQMPDTISPAALVRYEPRDVTPSDNQNDNIEDSRLYLIKRRRSQARHGIARRISSRRLPLEVVSNHLTMRNASTSLRPPVGKVAESLFIRADKLDHSARKGEWGYAVEFESMGEVTKLEQRLHNVVESWKQTQNQPVEVEYKLRSAAKGKGKEMSDESLTVLQYCERWCLDQGYLLKQDDV
ncbi:histidine kinase-, DNA gyrase b-, and HSP90-like ATPase domain-containing protein [Trichoderma breve]|uniref:Histidine kinase-, DNA gyrase b-, and HSP90-like ATPase domain-containing protein n=1 Tax=Trichoderma breve TaxID=2034170 RepID=A0A9W9JR33_9HYPO|nr:histidine kinase-, DNA gyrase b-, and HSP90-like ATPase domain-containing protein [Trichoderma breve]KAJ4864270.1 histidine kinase-, DNA gyrase b-, and HSP90-like ATPase domain-containing protein [Trichoderma breve]